jgi:hypothetical protein
VFCGLESSSEGNAVLLLRAADGGRQEIEAHIEDSTGAGIAPEDWLRIAAATRIRELLAQDESALDVEATALALKHQLMSPFTNYLFVQQRTEDAAKDLPELRQTPSMLAAGWGGTGQVREDGDLHLAIPVPLRCRETERGREDEDLHLETRTPDYLDVPMFLRRTAEPDYSPRELIEFMNTRFTIVAPERKFSKTLDEPAGLAGSFAPIPLDVIDDLRELICLGWREDEVLIAFWTALMQHALAGRYFSRTHKHGITNAARLTPVAPSLMRWMIEALNEINNDEWHWRSGHDMPAPHEDTERSGTEHGNDTENT